MSDLSKNIHQAIKDSLPEAVAGELKEYIKQAETTKMLLDVAQEVVKTQEIELKELRPLKSKSDDVTRREREVITKENQFLIKDEIIKIREEHAKQRVDEIKDLTRTVFQSNRLGYNLNLSGSENLSGTMGGQYYNTTGSKTLSGSMEER